MHLHGVIAGAWDQGATGAPSANTKHVLFGTSRGGNFRAFASYDH